MSTQLSLEMSLLLAKMTEQLNVQTNTITENITAALLQKVDEKLKPVIEENAKLKNEVDKLNRKIENLEMNGRRNNVILHGVPEQKDEKHEDLLNLVTAAITDIEVQLNLGEIDRVQRLGKKGNEDGKTRPILLATTTLGKKIQILKNKKKMKPNTYITHDLPKDTYLKNKEKRNKERTENEKRKRSETPSPKNENDSPKNDPKIKKLDAFQYLRGRSISFSDKTTNRN